MHLQAGGSVVPAKCVSRFGVWDNRLRTELCSCKVDGVPVHSSARHLTACASLPKSCYRTPDKTHASLSRALQACKCAAGAAVLRC